MIQCVKGDLFEHLPVTDTKIYICHVVNNVGKMGSGFVVPLCHLWPQVKQKYEAWYKNKYEEFSLENEPFELGQIQRIQVEPKIIVVNMIAQSGVVGPNNPKPIKYVSLAQCMDTVRKDIIEGLVSAEIHAPKFGSDRARGNWDFIAELIEECWTGAGIPVTIYEL